MSEQIALDLPSPPARGVGWIRHKGICRANYQMTVDGEPNGIWVRECGHPTALRPYYVRLPGGWAARGTYRLVGEAKAAAVAIAKLP